MPRWTQKAASNLESILDYISEDNPAAAANVAKQIKEVANQLDQYPAMGRPGRRPGTRELVMPQFPYIIIYRMRQRTVIILQVLHAKLKYP